MSNYSPTIVAASLDDNELKQSVSNLVAHFKRALHTMKTDTDTTVEAIQKSLNKIGDIKTSPKGSSEKDSSRQKRAQEEVTQEIKKTTQAQKEHNQTLDQTAQGIQKAVQGSRVKNQSEQVVLQTLKEEEGTLEQINQKYAAAAAQARRRFEVSPVQQLRMEQHRIEAELRKAESTQLRNPEYQKALKETREELLRLARIRSELESKPTLNEKEVGRLRYITTEYERVAKSLQDLQRLSSGGWVINNDQTQRIAKLREEYDNVTGRIKTMGQSMIDANWREMDVAAAAEKVKQGFVGQAEAAKQVSSELQKQVQTIQNRKDATGAFEKISLMPSGTEEEIRAKGRILQEFIEKVRNTPLISQTNFKLAEKMLKSLANQIRAIREEKERTARTAPSTASDVVTKRSLEDEKKALEELRAREAQRREEIIRTGIAAQEQAYKIRESINQQMQTADYTKQLEGVKDLQTAVSQMRNALKQPLDSGVKQELERALAVSKQALDVAQRYNMTVAGMGGVGVGGKAPTDTLAAYAAEAQRLAGIYRNLTEEERKAAAGRGLIRKYQELSKVSKDLKKELERPVSFDDAMKGSAKTLDEMAYKMQRLRSFMQGADVNSGDFEKARKAIENLRIEMDKYMGKAQSATSTTNALTRSLNYMKNRLAFYFTVGAATSFVKNLIEIRSQYEMNERALGILIDSAERGTQIFKELSQMALVSPYTLIELSAAAKQLTAYDVAARDVVDTTRRLADMAAAVGIPIERLTYALGQIKAYGYLNSRDARMFANAGIPLVKQLSEYYTELEGKLVSTADVYDRIKKKAIDYNDVVQVVNKMTDEGGKFFDFQAKMAETLKVQLANLTLAWNNMMNEIGESNQGILTGSIGLLKNLFLQWRNIDKILSSAKWIISIRTAFMLLVWGALKAGNALGFVSKQMSLASVFGTKLAGVLRTVGYSLISVAKSPITWWSLLALAIWDAGNALLGVNEAQKTLNVSLREGAKSNFEDITGFFKQYKEVKDSLFEARPQETLHSRFTEYAPKDINENEAVKIWEVMRERIELSTHNADEYIARLMSISNVSERLRQGFTLLEDISEVNAALKELDDGAIKVAQDWSEWWNLWSLPDGLIGNLKDLSSTLKTIEEQYGSIYELQEKASKRKEAGVTSETASENERIDRAKSKLKEYEGDLATFRKDLAKTTESLLNFINLKGWSGEPTKIEETFSSFIEKLSLDYQLNPQQAFLFQEEAEESKRKALLEGLRIRIADEKSAIKRTVDEGAKAYRQGILDRLKEERSFLEKNTAKSRVYWRDFTKWMGERHRSEVQAMFGKMNQEQVKALDFSKGEYFKWVTDLAKKYADEHGLAYKEVFDILKNYVQNANQWSIVIPLIVSSEDKKTVYKQLGEYDKVIDEADAQIERLTKRINELNAKGAAKRTKEETEELTKAYQELTQAENDKAEAEAKGGHGKKEKKDARAASKAQKEAESELQKALKEELQLIDKVRSAYKALTDAGLNHIDAVEESVQDLEEPLANINKVLSKYGLKLDLSKFAGITNPHAMVKMLEEQVNTLLRTSTAKPAEIQDLKVKIKDLKLDAAKFDQKMITEGLNNELGRLKEEYELAVSLDADPEMGGLFASLFDIHMENLPRTAEEYAERYTKLVNEYLKQKGSDLQLPNLLNITADDMRAFKQQLDSGNFNKEWYDVIEKAYKETRSARDKEIKETEKAWSDLIKRYGDLQAKLVSLAKSGAVQQVSIIKKFGSEEERKSAINLLDMIGVEDDPQKLAELEGQLATMLQQITDRNPLAAKVSVAVKNATAKQTGKAYWDDFKDSDLYAMTFEDVAKVSNRAIDMMIGKLEELKDKVKESPESMKALIKAKNDLEKEKINRNPFQGIIDGLKDWREANKKVKASRKELVAAEEEVKSAQRDVENNKDGSPQAQAAAQERLANATKKRDAAVLQLTKDENTQRTAQDKTMSSAQELGNKMQAMGEIANKTAELFRLFGDDDTAELLGEIGNAFTALVPTIVAVAVAIKTLESTSVILLAISAAAAVLIGVISFFSGQENKKITEAVEESERAVKKLENRVESLKGTYDALTDAAEHSYGAQSAAATLAASSIKEQEMALKRLMLAETRRQLRLEQSRDSKDRDEDKILSLQKDIISQQNEIDSMLRETSRAVDEVVDSLLGISRSSWAEELTDALISAFKAGEDYMDVFSDSWEEMVQNLVVKTIAAKVIGDALQKQVLDRIEAIENEETAPYRQQEAELARHKANLQALRMEDEMAWFNTISQYQEFQQAMASLNLSKEEMIAAMQDIGWAQKFGFQSQFLKQYGDQLEQALFAIYDGYATNIENGLNVAQQTAQERALREVLTGQTGAQTKQALMDSISSVFPEFMETWGYKFGQESDKTLSALQQGISNISEDTAGAIEAYLSIVSQRIFYHGTILEQIRDTMQGFNMDIQLSVQSQMLLQLQQSFTVQQAIQSILEGVLAPSGRSFSVSLVS